MLILAALVPTILTTPIGIVLLVSGGSNVVALVSGILVLAFCAASVTGYILGSMFMRRGAHLVKVQTDFLSAVSHELRTPMTAMGMLVSALRDQRLADPQQRDRCLDSLQHEIARLDGLVGRLLDLTRIESGRHLLAREPVAVAAVVADAGRALAALALPAMPQLEVDLAPDLMVHGDHSALVQVLANLLSNAWKYGPADGLIRVQALARGRQVVLTVRDQGPGIPAGEQRRIFETFERGAAAVAAGIPGTGIGLAIARALVQAQGGRIELTSAPGQGATFAVLLPRHQP